MMREVTCRCPAIDRRKVVNNKNRFVHKERCLQDMITVWAGYETLCTLTKETQRYTHTPSHSFLLNLLTRTLRKPNKLPPPPPSLPPPAPPAPPAPPPALCTLTKETRRYTHTRSHSFLLNLLASILSIACFHTVLIRKCMLRLNTTNNTSLHNINIAPTN